MFFTLCPSYCEGRRIAQHWLFWVTTVNLILLNPGGDKEKLTDFSPCDQTSDHKPETAQFDRKLLNYLYNEDKSHREQSCADLPAALPPLTHFHSISLPWNWWSEIMGEINSSSPETPLPVKYIQSCWASKMNTLLKLTTLKIYAVLV